MCLELNENNNIKNELEMMNKIKNKSLLFEKFNTTSISKLLVSMSGNNGVKCEKLSISLYKKFVTWYSTNKKDCYFPETGFIHMYPLKSLKTIINIYEDREIQTNKLDLFTNEINKSEKDNINMDNDTNMEVNIKSTPGISQYDFSEIQIHRDNLFYGMLLSSLSGCLIYFIHQNLT